MDGFDTVPDENQPPVFLPFWGFRIMVGIGLLMLGIGLWSLWARHRKRLYDWASLHKAAVIMGPSGFIAVIAGWVTAEVGRQPYTVYGLLRTSDSVSPLDAPAVAVSLLAFIVVYTAVFGVGIWYTLRLMSHTPLEGEKGIKSTEKGPMRTAGLTPGPTQNPGGAGDALPGSSEEVSDDR